MEYFTILVVALLTLYTLSYARHSLKKRNKRQAVGAILVSLISIALPILLIFSNRK